MLMPLGCGWGAFFYGALMFLDFWGGGILGGGGFSGGALLHNNVMRLLGHMDIPAEALGPKMLALREERQRLFVWWMANGAPSATAAARAAGYSDVKEGAKVRACVLMQSPAIIEALNECAGKTLKTLAPFAITQARRILQDPTHPGHARMIETILDRSGHSAKTEHKVVVEHTADVKALEEFARRLAAENGISADRLLGVNASKSGEKIDKPLQIEGEVVDEPS